MADNQSGISADLLSYPEVLELKDVPEMGGAFVYPVKAYPLDGIAVLAEHGPKMIGWRFGDWDGNILDLARGHPKQGLVERFVIGYSEQIGELMRHIRLQRALLYISTRGDDIQLVDLRVSLNKMAGPGMLNDLFGNIMPIQEVIGQPIILKDDDLQKVTEGIEPYNCDLILKPSKFKTIVRGKTLSPLYAMVKRYALEANV